jgi:hypothetical protein
LLPLAVYVFVLAQLNRRRHPVMVSGVWDFAGVLFALSGFLLLGGPFILASFNQDWRDFWIRSPLRATEGLSEEWWYLRLAIWGFYFLAIAGGSALLLRWRSYVTCVYNVDPEALDQSLAEALDRLQLPWKRSRNRVFIDYPAFTEGQEIQEIAVSGPRQLGVKNRGLSSAIVDPQSSILNPPSSILDPQSPAPSQGLQDSHKLKTVLEIEAFPATHHVTLHWPDGGGQLRKDVEADLAKVLANVESTYNPAFTWLMSLATVLLSAVSFGLLMVILFVIFVFYGDDIAR